MTRKHFQAIADEIARIENLTCRIEAAHAVARAVKQFNPAFDVTKFYHACDVVVL
jgi:hypothetical protein